VCICIQSKLEFLNKTATEMIPLGKLNIGRYALKVPLGALGGDYGDCFLQVGEKDVEFVRNSPYWDNSPYLFSNSYSPSSISTVYWYY
jgi:hypothetical protein